MTVSDLTKAQEGVMALFGGALGAPIVAWLYWEAVKVADCTPGLVGEQPCVVTASGTSYSWMDLAKAESMVILAFALAGVLFGILEVIAHYARQREASAAARLSSAPEV